MEEILHRYNPWWSGSFAFPGISRDRYLANLEEAIFHGDVVIISGLRRVGKTTLMRQMIHRLLERVDPERIFYMSLDSYALKEYSILDIVEAYRRVMGLRYDDEVYLFLDEVHYKEDFELQLKNLYDMGHSRIVASGSCSPEIITRTPYLTGRYRIIPMRPLDFQEYLRFTGREISAADSHLFPVMAKEYVLTGGMPEYVITGDEQALQSILDGIIYRDIVARHDIRDTGVLKDLLIQIARSVSTPLSIRRISRTIGIKFETARRFVNYLREAGLLYQVERWGKLPERKRSPVKFYLADTGFFSVLLDRINMGALVENTVYLKLSEAGDVRYWRLNGMEVDFVIDGWVVEVKYRDDLDGNDLRPLMNQKRRRLVVTEEREGEINGIQLVPLWRFLLDGMPR